MKYRLVTRSDFDRLVCAVLLRHLDLIGDITFVHPKDVQDGAVDVGPTDILTNLPYAPGAHLVFDHHHSETLRTGGLASNHVIDAEAPSAARVIWGKQKLNTVFAVGRSILDRSSPTDIGSVMLQYGGGGHLAAGTCQVPHDRSEQVLHELIEKVGAPMSSSASRKG
ncbi:hypothetical protein ACPPVO_59140 [Dactylosporangium sp. McL0621]|uniref:hypothetical protein n=1 Tax=Dactylosporangium sp. McL0621 TaxID=3415678 RepID=UPI003CECC24B